MPPQKRIDPDPVAQDFSRYARVILHRSALVLGLAVLLGWSHRAPVGAGLALGGAFSILKLRLRVNRLTQFHAGPAAKSFGRAWAWSITVYLLTAGILAAAAARPSISLGATVAGVFLTNAVLIAEQVVPWLRVSPPLDTVP